MNAAEVPAPPAADEFVVIPETDGEVAQAVGLWEEFFLLLASFEADEAPFHPPLPRPLGGREVLDVVGELVVQVRRLEAVAVQPVAPDGRFELVPLLFVPLSSDDRARIVAAVEHVDDGHGHYLVRETLEAFELPGSPASSQAERIEQLLGIGRRLVALLQLPVDDDVDKLHHVLAPGEVPERVVLPYEAHQAYERVTARILAAWHQGDPLDAWLYRG